MIKQYLKKILFRESGWNWVRFGISSGRKANYNPNDRSQHLLGLYEREIHDILDKSCKRARILIDIGANDGYYGLAFTKYPDTRRILCEPGVENLELRNNMSLNGFECGRDYVLIDKWITNQDTSGEMSINTLMKDLDQVLVLIDVDGGEGLIIDGYDFSNQRRVDWLIETHSIELENAIVKRFTAEGYHVEIIDKAWWRIIIPEQRPLEHNRWLFATINPAH